MAGVVEGRWIAIGGRGRRRFAAYTLGRSPVGDASRARSASCIQGGRPLRKSRRFLSVAAVRWHTHGHGPSLMTHHHDHLQFGEGCIRRFFSLHRMIIDKTTPRLLYMLLLYVVGRREGLAIPSHAVLHIACTGLRIYARVRIGTRRNTWRRRAWGVLGTLSPVW